MASWEYALAEQLAALEPEEESLSERRKAWIRAVVAAQALIHQFDGDDATFVEVMKEKSKGAVLIDYSPLSDEAIRYGQELAERLGLRES